MAETKAEDEDDEWGFGDFTFAAPVSIHTDKNTNKDDDEWGDFVESPLQSATALSPNQLFPSKNLSGFSSSSDLNHQGGGVGSDGKSTQWVKLKGALPLSLFGEEEEEEEEEGSGAVDLSAGDGKGSFIDDKRNGYLKNESNSRSGVGINDIIVNLYSQNHQIKAEENGVNSSPNVNETKSDSNAINLDSGMNLSRLNRNLDNQSHEPKNENGLSANFGGLKFEFDGSNSNLNGTNLASSGVNFHIDSSITNTSGLNLTAGNSNTDIHTSVSNQNQEIKIENGLISNSNRLNSYSDVSSSNFGGWNLNVGGLSSNAEPVTVNKELDDDDDGDDDGWEFKDAYSDSKVENKSDKGNVALEFPAFHMQTESKIRQELQEFPEVTKFSSEFGKGSQGQDDLFAMSNGVSSKSHGMNIDFDLNGVSSKSHGMNIDFDFNPGLVSQNGFTSDSYWQIAPKDSKNGLNSHPLTEKADSNETNGKFDLFAMSNGFTSKSQDTAVEFNFMTGMVPQNGFISDSYLQSKQNDMKNGLDSHPLAENADFDETFGDFDAAFLDTSSKQEEELKVNGPSPAEAEAFIFNGRNQGNEMKLENRNGPMPLSIFGEEEPETDTSLNIQDAFMSKQAPHSGNVHSRDPSLSISDLLSNLYSQADSTRVDSMHKPTKNGLVSANRVSSSDLLDGGDDFEDDSWEFKDAVSQVRTNNETPLHSSDDGDQSFSTKTKLNTYVDFYCKLKDELCLVSRCHLVSLKEARSITALSGEVGKLAALDEEIQDACNELDHENIMYKEVDEEDHTPREICLKEFLDALHELNFQALDSEFELSRKLPLAEKDLKSAIELIKHATSIMKILTLVSTEEQRSYVSTWLKIISICTQELKHGTRIWKHSLENNVKSQILSEPQGKRFILALGEIYRVVLVLGASVRLYKPWILSSSVNLVSIYALLEECHSLWSSSGLEEAIQSISDLSGSEYYGTVDALLASIKRIRDTDAFALENHVFGQQGSVCLLSGLTPELVPDMKMVVWNGEHYFLTLANLWANLISCVPPKLQRLKVG